MDVRDVIFLAFLVTALALPPPSLGQDEVEGAYSPCSVYNPVHTISINTCCNETSEHDKELWRELQDIKVLLNTIKTSLENGDYCCNGTRPRDCYEVLQSGETTSKVYTIYPDGSSPFNVYCDMDTDGGGWTIFQRREDGSRDFFLYWADYVNGFGALNGEHWLGNEKLYHLSNQKSYHLRVDLRDFEEEARYAVYDSFVVADASDNYRLTLGAYSGDAGDAMAICNGQQFSTRDQDNDEYEHNCAERFKGGWWYESCHLANPNGLYLSGTHSSYADGVEWHPWHGYYYSLKRTEMKLRPV